MYYFFIGTPELTSTLQPIYILYQRMCKPTNILKILNYCNKNAKFLQYLVKISQFLSSLSSLKSFVCTMRTKKPFICLNYIHHTYFSQIFVWTVFSCDSDLTTGFVCPCMHDQNLKSASNQYQSSSIVISHHQSSSIIINHLLMMINIHRWWSTFVDDDKHS